MTRRFYLSLTTSGVIGPPDVPGIAVCVASAISNTHFIAYGGADVAMLAAQKCTADDKHAGQSIFWSQRRKTEGRLGMLIARTRLMATAA